MLPTTDFPIAPELQVHSWINSPSPLSLSALKGKVVVLHAFQMLCPGCVSHAIPQANQIHVRFMQDDVQVIGLHSVFEHHNAMTPDALRAFIQEYRLPYPVAIDTPSTISPTPLTMKSYKMKGTPTLVIIDQQGRIRLNHFGRLHDMHIGSIIGGLLAEEKTLTHRANETRPVDTSQHSKCNSTGCLL